MQMKELTRCPQCKRPLVGHEEVHAIDGLLFCSKNCAVSHITEDYLMNAREMALEDYASEAEVVRTDDVLKNELQTVEIIVTCRKRIHLPINMSREEACHEARNLHDEGLVIVEPDDCEEIDVEYKLVEDENSLQVD